MPAPSFSTFKMGRNASAQKLKLVPSLMADTQFIQTPPPPVLDRSHLNPSFKMFFNDTIGDCTCAAVYNTLIAWQSLVDSSIAIPEVLAVELYSAITGYTPDNPQTDQGAAEDDVLAYGVKNGFATRDYTYYPLWGTVDCGNINMMATLMSKLGVAYQGVYLRKGDLDLLDAGQVLDVVPNMDMQIAGGHALLLWDYTGLSLNSRVRLITWGSIVTATWAWVLARSVESHGLVFPQLMSPAHQKLFGLDWTALRNQNQAFLNANILATA